MERRLAAIMAADVVGYSRLIRADEEGTLVALKTLRTDLIDPKIASHHGRIVKLMGDGMLAEFPSVVSAVRAAAEVLQAVAERNADLPQEQHIEFRVGINLGDVVIDGDDIHGDGVNVAARLEGLAEPGSICVSGNVYDEVRDRIDLLFEDLGERDLKNIDRPVHVWRWTERLLPVEARKTDTSDPPRRLHKPRLNNLPRQLSSFVGREREIGEVKQLLSATRLLTLTGAGGCGKTRLSIQVGGQALEEFPDGVWLVELVSLADAVLVPQAVASALNLREQPGRPLTATISEYLEPRTVLLLLDNCEHLLSGCAQLAGKLLRECAGLRILATSREPLGVTGEMVHQIPGLKFPDFQQSLSPEQLASYEAIQLFVARAGLRSSGFAITPENAAAVAKVCDRLDGIPLAIELAAARVNILTAEQIADRLDDRFRLLTDGSRTGLHHHQTLRMTMDWSYGLLSEEEAILLQRLSVFAGGFALEAVEAVCVGGNVTKADVLDLLQHLADKSMMNAGEDSAVVRFRLLETVRQYGREKLEAAGDLQTVKRNHMEYFLNVAEKAGPELEGSGRGSEQTNWLDRLEADHDNFWAALEWSFKEGHAQAGVRLAGALWRYWEVRGNLREGRAWLRQARASGEGISPAALAKALDAEGRLAGRQGEFQDAKNLFEESLVLWRAAGDKAGEANSLHGLARAAVNLGDNISARSWGEESLTIHRELENKQGIATAINLLGEVARSERDFARAETLYGLSLAILREIGDTAHSVSILHNVLHNLGYTALVQRNLKTAEVYFVEALTICRNLKDQLGIFSMLGGFAGLALAVGQPQRAARLLSAAEIIRQAGGYASEGVDQAQVDQNLAATRVALDDAAFDKAWTLGEAMSAEEAIEYALTGDQFPQSTDQQRQH